jgi:hypothetical protein
MLHSGGMNVNNSTIAGNIGVGIYDYQGALSVDKSTISGNSASGSLYGWLFVSNNIISNDTGYCGAGISNAGHFITNIELKLYGPNRRLAREVARLVREQAFESDGPGHVLRPRRVCCSDSIPEKLERRSRESCKRPVKTVTIVSGPDRRGGVKDRGVFFFFCTSAGQARQ